MDRLGAGTSRGVEDRVAAQVALLRPRAADVHRLVAGGDVRRVRVGVGIHGDGAQSQFSRSARDAARDLAAVRDEDFREHGN
jgi:hypothetical protein